MPRESLSPEKKRAREKVSDYLNKLYDRTDEKRTELYEHPRYGLSEIEYVEITTKDIPEKIMGQDSALLSGAFAIASAMMAAETRIFILRDIVPEKYRRYHAIHEFYESIHLNHWWAIEDEFQAAEKEMPKKEYIEYCRHRFSAHFNDIDTIKKMRNAVSQRTKKIVSDILHENGICLRRPKKKHQ